MSANKKRLDLLLLDRQLASSRQRAQAMIMAGRVLVDRQRVDKPGAAIDACSVIEIKGEDLPFVSRGGLKLDEALKQTGLSVQGRICMDVGASTGGFTDCLLQSGAKKVYAVDVGYGQLAWALRKDSRVIPIERTNIRHMSRECIPEDVSLITVDVSFISLKIVVPAVLKFMSPGGFILPLIKPQFEVGKGNVGKGGVVKDPEKHQEVINELIRFFTNQGLDCGPVIPSPVLGPKGNREFMVLLKTSESIR